MSLEDYLFNTESKASPARGDYTTTRTYEYERLSDRVKGLADPDKLILSLMKFNDETKSLRDVPRKSLYYEFYIPKKTGGLRRIDAPNEALKRALRELKKIFEKEFGALYHTSAYAYIPGRSTVSALERHRENESRWFAKYDLSNFFGSTTLAFIMRQLSMIFPFCEVMRTPSGRRELETAIELCTLDGILPQGTPISPMLTNLVMIPIDFVIARALREFNTGDGHTQHFIYTRYADDFQISSRYDFRFREIENFIRKTLAEMGTPYIMKPEKTRYGSSSGSNWNLGLMLNANNEITVGHKKKRQLQAMIASYIMDKRNGKNWDLHDVQVMDGLISYYSNVEGKDKIKAIVSHVAGKFGVDVFDMIRRDLSCLTD